MTAWRTAVPARFGMPMLLSACLLATGAASAATATRHYRGRTTQREPISFTYSRNAIRTLSYKIDDRCSDGKRLYVSAFGFPPLPVKHGRFAGTFSAKKPAKATATVSGTVFGRRISGLITDRSIDRKTGKVCTARARFRLMPKT